MKMLLALIRKEFFQIVRDPSSILIAFVLPLILLLIYMYGINLDTIKVKLGIKNDDPSPEVQTLVKSFNKNRYVQTVTYYNKEQMQDDLVGSKIRAFVVIPNDFSRQLARGQIADLQVVTDGAEVNLSYYATAYVNTIALQWLMDKKHSGVAKPPLISPEVRYWFNQEINSRYFIGPGSIAITMTLTGLLLTALVISREWERGTMESLLTAKTKKIHIVLSKYIAYFVLGMASMAFSVFMCIVVFQIPFRGNHFILLVVCGLFLFTSLGFGLLISTNARDQFLASQIALALGFLPVLMLSGLFYEINSMPRIMQEFTKIIPARYFVSFIQSEFMAGTIWKIVLINSLYLAILGMILFGLVMKSTKMRLD